MYCPLVFGPISSSQFERDAQTVAFFVSVLLVNLLLQCVFTSLSFAGSADNFWYRDGKSNYMEGLMLITLYLVIAMACTCSAVLLLVCELTCLSPH